MCRGGHHSCFEVFIEPRNNARAKVADVSRRPSCRAMALILIDAQFHALPHATQGGISFARLQRVIGFQAAGYLLEPDQAPRKVELK